MDLLAQMGLGRGLLAALIIFFCLLLILVILLQKGRGGGLAGAFGGGGGSNAFGAKTGDVFTWITVVVAGVFVLLAIVGNFAFDQSAVATVETPTVMEPTTSAGDTTTTGEEPGRVVLPVEGDVDAATVFLEQRLPDGTIVSTPIEVELLTEPVDKSTGGQDASGGGAAADKPAGTAPDDAQPPEPNNNDVAGSGGAESPPSGDEDPATP